MSAINTVDSFLSAAGNGRWEEAVEHAQASWIQDMIARGRQPARELERAFTMLGVLGARVGGDAIPPGPEHASPLMLDVPVEFDTKFGTMRALMRVIRELAPYQPSEHGRWGVHPASIRRTVEIGRAGAVETPRRGAAPRRIDPAETDDRERPWPQQVEWKSPPTGFVAASSL